MRKKMLLLALTLTVVAFSLQARAEAAGGYACVQCSPLPSGAQCCITCWCEDVGRFQIMSCPAIGCAEI